MLFSRAWIGEYVDLPDTDELVEGLTQVGLNVEGVETQEDDEVLDLEVTPNRPDCMNHLGVAREVAVRFGSELRPPEVREIELGDVGVDIQVADLADCPRYVGVVVDGVTVGPSPEWLTRRLTSIGVRPINNVVDVTNFVLWEMGQPLHAFDLDTLAGGTVCVRRAGQKETLTTLDGVERQLDPDVLVIADADRTVALAGIMGGADTEVKESTGRILIESAHFHPTVVRKAASKLGMHTDASHRFERGTDPEGCARAAVRAAQLLADVAGGEMRPGVADVADEGRCWHPQGSLDHHRLQSFGGVEVAAEEVERILGALGYEAKKGEGGWRVTQPSWRYYDQESFREQGEIPEIWPADLYEEVLRVVGFDAIPATLPRISQPDAGSSLTFLADRSLRHRIAGLGFIETISYAFESEKANQSFASILADADPVEVRNPVSESFRWMRRSVLPGLVEAAQFNQRYGAETVELFEVGHIFTGDGREVDALGLVVGGGLSTPWDRDRGWDFYSLKGAIEDLLPAGSTFEVEELGGFVTGAAATILDAEGERVGQIGEVAGADLAFPLFACELAVDAVARPEPAPVIPPSRHPAVTADITLTHAADLPWSEIERSVNEQRADELSEFGLKDRYEGEGVPQGAVNTTIWFRYNAGDRSLTQDEVNSFQQSIRNRLEEEFAWQAKTSS